VCGKLFAALQIRGGIVQNRKRRGPFMLALALAAVALLFFFEWLGSEQPQEWVETPIAVPPDPDGKAKQD
jgi:hypothetical protein